MAETLTHVNAFMNFSRENNLLFCEGDLSATLQAQVANLRAEIDGFASDYVLKISFAERGGSTLGR